MSADSRLVDRTGAFIAEMGLKSLGESTSVFGRGRKESEGMALCSCTNRNINSSLENSEKHNE